MEAARPPKDAEALLAHTGWMRSLASSLVRDPLQADDLVQDAFVAAIERRERAPENLRGWLAGVLRNLARIEFRSAERRRRREELAARREATASAGDIVERADLHRRLVEAVLRLEEPYLSAVLLRYFDGMKPGEIARRKGVPESTARTWISRGIEKLRRSLEPADPAERHVWRSGLLALAGWKEGGAATSTMAGVALGGTIVKVKAVLFASILACAALGIGVVLVSRGSAGPGESQGVNPPPGLESAGRAGAAGAEEEARRERDLLLGRISELEEELRRQKAKKEEQVEAPGDAPPDGLPPDIQGALRSWNELVGDADSVWEQLHGKGDLAKMEEFTATVGTLIPLRLAGEALTDAERASFERLLDLNGFRKGYVKFALGDFQAAEEALEEHIRYVDAREAELRSEGRTLDKGVEIYRDMRSKDVLRFLRERAGRPAPSELDFGEGWVTEKQLLLGQSTGKVVAMVFRHSGDMRSASFLVDLSRFSALRLDVEVVTLGFITGDHTIEEAREDLKNDLARIGYAGSAGIDPDSAGHSLFRQWQANVGSATFMIVDREGRLAWYMPDPRSQDQSLARRILDRIAGAR
jgi:RNA polymerase sigma-70 factor (ECF subfamily)